MLEIKKVIRKNANKEKAKILQRFFKTGEGEYGEGDVFLGLQVPVSRGIAKKFPDLSLKDVGTLLKSEIHEERLIAWIILVNQFKKADEAKQEKIYKFYIKNAKRVNNWDLVDLSAEYIVGEYLYERDRSPLYKLARSKNLWEKRISMLSTFAFIKKGETKDTFKIAELLMDDTHDLIHKAVGWMIREAGKRADEKAMLKFLNKHAHHMPRTMLRYSIENLNPKLRKKYLEAALLQK
jgi:Predicted DNA alkylation repair enzyme